MPQIQVHSPPNYPPLLTPSALPTANALMPNPHPNLTKPFQFGNQLTLLAPPSPMQVAQQVSYQRISPPRYPNNASN